MQRQRFTRNKPRHPCRINDNDTPPRRQQLVSVWQPPASLAIMLDHRVSRWAFHDSILPHLPPAATCYDAICKRKTLNRNTLTPPCPKCECTKSCIIQTDALRDGSRVRRRKCDDCGYGWYTMQPAEERITDTCRLIWEGNRINGLRPPAESTENDKLYKILED